MSPKPVILDVDPGHDDAVALMLACGHPDLDLLAVTTVAGNVSLEKTTRNALRVLSLVGCTDVPVGAGAPGPLERSLHTAEDIHGKSGLDGPEEIPEAGFEPDERGAVALIAATLRASTEPVTLVPVGPLTNVAAFLHEHPDLKDRIAHISLMGGSMGLGNTTPAAEFNIYVDPEAAREVFESGLPITMSGLDITHQAGAGPDERERLRATGRVGGVVAGFLDYFAATYESVFGFDAPPLHDPVAVAAVLEPRLLKTRPMRVDIECESDLTRGETVCDFYGVTGSAPNARSASISTANVSSSCCTGRWAGCRAAGQHAQDYCGLRFRQHAARLRRAACQPALPHANADLLNAEEPPQAAC